MHTLTPCSIRYAKNLTAIVTPKGEIQLSLHGVYDGLKPISVDLNDWKAIASSIVEAVNNHERLTAENQAMREALAIAKITIERLAPTHGVFNSVQGTLDIINKALTV